MISLVAKKIGMSHIYKENGEAIPFTMVKLYDNIIVDIKNSKNEDCERIIVGYDKAEKQKLVSKPLAGIFNKSNLPIHRKIFETKISKNSNYKIGDSILVEGLINVGDSIDVRGISKGKGFAGVMKRHNFRGLEASHGVSISHRSHGSTGQRQDPGKVFKGKKMAGHLGVDNITIKNLEVLVVDKENNTICIKGSIPGSRGGDVIIKLSN